MFSQIDKKRKLLDSNRPLPLQTVASLKEKMIIEWTYHSNAIEGNTLTMMETKVVLEGITVGGKSIREHLEIINHKEAILYLEELVKKESLSEWDVKNLHGIILRNIDHKHAGMYRNQNVFISGASHTPMDYVQVEESMRQLIYWYDKDAKKVHPIERATYLHAEFVKIHPFIDGNGRTARLLLNLELIKSGYPPIVIKKEERLDYYLALDRYSTTGELTDFLTIVCKLTEQQLDFYNSLARIEDNQASE